MVYRSFGEERLSALGLGAMRLPQLPNGEIDEAQALLMVDEAMRGGINYYDTAWGYHNGKSEPFMGRALSRYPRESFFLATKFPGYALENFGKATEIFKEQLQRCGVSYFDFYLCHNVCEQNIDSYLDDAKFGTVSYLKQQRDAGKIRHLGFSAHGNLDTMRRFLEAYGKEMEFCQIQFNYLDYSFQNAKEKLELLAQYHLPVWVMEPLRGGKLVNLPSQEKEKLGALGGGSPAEYAFRFIEGFDCIGVTLSGMSSLAQLRDNLRIFSELRPLTQTEKETLQEIAQQMTKRTSVPCTACRYCTSYCARGLDIPYLLKLYNEHAFTKDFAFIAPMAIAALPKEKRPSACIGCRRCEAVCPQNIKISDVMKKLCL